MHWYGKSPPKPRRKMGHLNVIAESAAAAAAALLSLQGEGDAPPPAPRVGVIMGSDSDLGCMRAAAEVRERIGEDLANPCNPTRCWRLQPRASIWAATPRVQAHEDVGVALAQTLTLTLTLTLTPTQP